MPSLISDQTQRLDTSSGTPTGLPTEDQLREGWVLSVANADAVVAVPDVPENEWMQYVDEARDWSRLAFDAVVETWPVE